ncbi:MAG: SPFH domain-containing protein [Ruminococcus sp.]|jgi:regulator of protease activity HflC (stomatin/prohibitin superfamily)|nr:SPFH domain-containing protein [Ruminococcus sp.]
MSNFQFQEKQVRARNGFVALFLNTLFIIGLHVGFVLGLIEVSKRETASEDFGFLFGVTLVGYFVLLMINIMIWCGLKIIRPNEAYVFTCFGKYVGTLQKDGFYWVNPFYVPYNPAAKPVVQNPQNVSPTPGVNVNVGGSAVNFSSRKISLKVQSLKNDKQKVNDELGNPIEVGINVFWKINDVTKAVFNVENYEEYLSMQADAALRTVVRSFPYDVGKDSDEMSLRASSVEVAKQIQEKLQEKAEIAGIEITEARITQLAYAPEIAAAMLQRQQAAAIIDARRTIVDGAVGMVEMALQQLSEKKVVDLDDERRAQMVSNLLVVLCGNRDAQPIVNSGSIY